ncbi:hypothetical protein DL93DRAFT_2078282 [Clavulina sp. PMI_390]|nr:hypothetical protein DL93DRAFT_2078282 [Clavulina sp. PMI_390]
MPFFDYPHGILEFHVDHLRAVGTKGDLGHSSRRLVTGFGLWKVWGQGDGVGVFDPTPAEIDGDGRVKERAEVWFERVDDH